LISETISPPLPNGRKKVLGKGTFSAEVKRKKRGEEEGGQRMGKEKKINTVGRYGPPRDRKEDDGTIL